MASISALSSSPFLGRVHVIFDLSERQKWECIKNSNFVKIVGISFLSANFNDGIRETKDKKKCRMN